MDGDSVGTALAALVEGMRGELDTLANDLAGHCLDRIADLPADSDAAAALVASAAGHVETVLDLLDPGTPIVEESPPPAATAYSELMARRGVAAETVMHANRLGLGWFWEVWRARVAALGTAEPLRAELLDAGIAPVLAYSERSVARIPGPHTAERRRFAPSPETVRAAEVRRLLSGDAPSEDATAGRLGYRLDATHTALVAWTTVGGADGLAAAVGALLQPAGGALVVPGRRGELWAWSAAPLAFDAAALAPRLHVAVGEPGAGVAGFRRSHGEALAAAEHARRSATTTALTRYRDVAATILLTADRERALEFAHAELGALGADAPAAARLRETVAAYLAHGSRFAAAAAPLGIHENTVAYRVRRAEALLGRPLAQRRFEVEAALRILAGERPAVAAGPR